MSSNFFKDHVIEIVIAVIVNVIVTIVTSKLEIINQIIINIKLSYLLPIITILITLLVLYIFEKRKMNLIRKELDELKNPANKKVKLFNLGDQVIRKIDEKMLIPRPFSVFKIESNRIHCRNEKDEIKEYAPDELYTAIETKQIIEKKEAESRRIEEENNREWGNIFGNW